MVISLAPGFPLLWAVFWPLTAGCAVTDFKAHHSFSLDLPNCRLLSETIPGAVGPEVRVGWTENAALQH